MICHHIYMNMLKQKKRKFHPFNGENGKPAFIKLFVGGEHPDERKQVIYRFYAGKHIVVSYFSRSMLTYSKYASKCFDQKTNKEIDINFMFNAGWHINYPKAVERDSADYVWIFIKQDEMSEAEEKYGSDCYTSWTKHCRSYVELKTTSKVIAFINKQKRELKSIVKVLEL